MIDFYFTKDKPYHNWFYFFQFIDLADSMFFVARKKFTHLSPLHVIHHGTLPLLCWWGPRWQIGSLLSWFILLTWTISGLLEEVRVALVPSWTLVCTWWCTSTTSLQPVAHPSKSKGLGMFQHQGLSQHFSRYLWWKRYLTTMQMVQFVLVFIHALQVNRS